MINIDNVLIFEEWKDSTDYFIQSWFLEKKHHIEDIFKSESLDGFEYVDFEWSGDDIYSIYNGTLRFTEKNVDYRLDIVIQLSDVTDNNINKINIILSSFDTEKNMMLGKISKEISSDKFNDDFFINMISELKDSYRKQEENE